MTVADGRVGDGREIVYLSMDPVTSTVGSSQVVAYLCRLAERGIAVHLHSFEHQVGTRMSTTLDDAGVRWTVHRYGKPGASGGLSRVVRLARAIRGSHLVHARSDMAAAAAMLAGVDHWLWDVRSFWADQKVATGVFTEESPQARIFRRIERAAAKRSERVVTLTGSAIAELDRRYGDAVGSKATVITTCVDRRRFRPVDAPSFGPIRLLLAGTLNRYYDVPLMLEFVRELQRREDVELVVATPGETEWGDELASVDAVRTSATPDQMPSLIASCHAGLSVCRDDAGASLLAAMPTKIGEFLAVGRPVVVNAGLADAATLLSEVGAGVVLGGRSGVDQGVDRLLDLVGDRQTTERAVALAASHFDLDEGVDRLIGVYREMGCSA